MRNSYNYFIKNLPLEKCPPDLTDKIIQAARIGLANKPSINGAACFCFPIWNYGLTCLIAVVLIITALTINPSNQHEQQQRLASNTTIIAKQISSNMKTILMNERRCPQ